MGDQAAAGATLKCLGSVSACSIGRVVVHQKSFESAVFGLSGQFEGHRDRGTKAQSRKTIELISLYPSVPLSLSFFVPMGLCTFVPGPFQKRICALSPVSRVLLPLLKKIRT